MQLLLPGFLETDFQMLTPSSDTCPCTMRGLRHTKGPHVSGATNSPSWAGREVSRWFAPHPTPRTPGSCTDAGSIPSCAPVIVELGQPLYLDKGHLWIPDSYIPWAYGCCCLKALSWEWCIVQQEVTRTLPLSYRNIHTRSYLSPYGSPRQWKDELSVQGPRSGICPAIKILYAWKRH